MMKCLTYFDVHHPLFEYRWSEATVSSFPRSAWELDLPRSASEQIGDAQEKQTSFSTERGGVRLRRDSPSPRQLWNTERLSLVVKDSEKGAKAMRLLSIFVVEMLMIALPFQTGAQQAKLNLGFEQVDASTEKPHGWFQWGTGYSLVADSLEKHSGKYSLRIEPGANVHPNSFGSCACSLPADYEGRQIELRAHMKLRDVREGFAGLLLRIDGAGGVLAFDNMGRQEIHGTSDWKQYTIQLPLAQEAKTIYLGAILTGKGTMWVDDFELLIDGDDLSVAKPKPQKEYKAERDKAFDKGSGLTTIKLTDQIVQNLTALGKVWGFLKYYHPSIAEGEYNWDYELFRIMPEILNVRSKGERNKVLSQWVDKMGKVDVAQDAQKVDRQNVKLLPDLKWTDDNSELGEILTKQLSQIRNSKRGTEHYYIDMVPGVGNPRFKNENSYSSMSYPDPGYRVLSFFRYWNIIQYFFPYKHLIGEDWNAVLPVFLPKFINAGNELEYKLAVLELIARVNDTHANIWQRDTTLTGYKGINYAPIEVKFVEDKVVVTDYSDDDLGRKTGLKKGDVIVSINGQSVQSITGKRVPLTPASNYPTQLRNIARDMLRTNDSTLTVGYQSNGITKTARIGCYPPEKANISRKYEQRDTCWRFLTKDIGYVYPGSIKNAYLPRIMSEFEHTKGIVIDFRCYPSEFIVFTFGEYLMPGPTDFVKFTNGSLLNPGLFTFTPNVKVGKQNPDYYKGKVIILINETTQSSAEYTTMAFRTAPRATVIGSTTAGADGNVSQFSLPGGINTLISGIGVYYPDGKETQRLGIVPDIELRPTIKGIRENRDELLEKAIEIINAEK